MTVLDLAGPYLEVPLVAAPPTPTLAAPPAAPSKLVVANEVCNQNAYSITLNWIDNANNEDGYRVYYNGGLIATLGPNATSFQYAGAFELGRRLRRRSVQRRGRI